MEKAPDTWQFSWVSGAFLFNDALDCGGLFNCVCKCFADLCFDLFAKFKIVCEEVLHSLATLCKFAVAVAEPASALLDDAVLHSEVEDFAAL